MYEIYNSMSLPIVALVGQSNVGKSSLFNRLTHTHEAMVGCVFGLTRDRHYGYSQYKKFQFFVVDTGGFNLSSDNEIQSCVNDQIVQAIKEASLVLFVIDGQVQASFIDYDIVSYLRKSGKEIILVINKIDNIYLKNKSFELLDYDFYGIKDVIMVSTIHKYGIDNLLDKVVAVISKILNYNKNNRFFSTKLSTIYNQYSKNVLFNHLKDNIISAVIGRPNSGKSTFINYISNTNRMITSSIPGTTRDNTLVPVMYDNQKYIFVDTAGVRKKKYINNMLEKISVSNTLHILQYVHVVIYMIDIQEGVVDQDLSLLRLVLKYSRSVIIVVNKWDISSYSSVLRKKIIELFSVQAGFLHFVNIHFISSLYGNGIKNLFELIKNIYLTSIKTINTALLTRIMQEAVIKYPPPVVRGTLVMPKPKFVHVGGYNPIIIVVHGTQVNRLSNQYRKYLKKCFYRALNFDGIVLRVRFKDTFNPFKGYNK